MELHRQIDKDLENLRDKVLLLGGEAEMAIQRGVRSLIERDSEMARQVLDHDDTIDQLEVEIDRLCIDIIALRQPAARDLRFVVTVIKMTPILERIADHACNIARVALELNDEPQLKSNIDLPRMADHASVMLHAALEAFTAGNADAARRVIGEDRELNILYTKLFHDLTALMVNDPPAAPRAARLMFVVKHIERIGDYVKDLCELTVFMTEAEIIKHAH
jgi:phosphate transport system protein